MDRIKRVTDITHSYWACNPDVSMVRNNPPQRHAADGDLPKPQDQGPDVPMPDATNDSATHGGQDQDSQPDQGQQPNPKALVPDNQEGLQLEQPQNNYAMVGAVPPKIVARQECKQVLQRIGFSVEAAQAIVQVHSYDPAEKLSHLRQDDVNILMKTLHPAGGESADRARDPGISVPHSTHQSLISLCFIKFHHS